jgi:hypothetical protein
MKKALVAMLVTASALGCGSNNSASTAALDKTFNYGPPQAPTASEQTAATSAQTTFSQTSTFAGQPDAASASAIVAISDTLSGEALGSTPIGLQADVPASRLSALSRSTVSSALTSTCTTVTATTVTFNNCTETDSSGFTLTLNGSITSTGSSVTWNTTGTFTGSAQSVSFNLVTHSSGTFTVTSTNISGNAISDLGGSVSSGGQTVSFGVSSAVVVSLAYQTTPTYCIDSGSIEVKRVWTQVPQGATGAEFTDLGVKITWTGCNTFQVAHSQ